MLPKPKYWDNAPFSKQYPTLYQSRHVSHLDPPKHTSKSSSHEPCELGINSASSVLGAKDGTSGSGGAMYLSPHGAMVGCCQVGVEAVFFGTLVWICVFELTLKLT